MSAKVKNYPVMIRVRCPSALPNLIEIAAQRQCMTPSEYIRRCLVDKLRSEGLDTSTVMDGSQSKTAITTFPIYIPLA